VYKGTFRQQEVAIKILKETPDVDQLVEFQKELDVLSRIRTPNLVFFYGACLSARLCIVTEYVESGTLYDYLNRAEVNITWKEVIHICIEIAKGTF
jgi:serine/threonine protein kinase